MNIELFKNNKYTAWYNNIISNALKRNINLPDNEKHHIIPKCMGGTQIVSLTKREHYICHLLLPKMVKLPEHITKMHYALWLMVNCTYKTTSHVYENARNNAVREMCKDRKGKKKTATAILNMSLCRIGKRKSPEVYAKISATLKGKPWSPARRAAQDKKKAS